MSKAGDIVKVVGSRRNRPNWTMEKHNDDNDVACPPLVGPR